MCYIINKYIISGLVFCDVCQDIFEWKKPAYFLYEKEHIDMTNAENAILYTQRVQLISGEHTKFLQPILFLKMFDEKHNESLQQKQEKLGI